MVELAKLVLEISIALNSFIFGKSDVLASAVSSFTNSFIEPHFVYKTISTFAEREVSEEEEIAFDTKYVKDDELEMGLEEVKEEGEPGKIIKKYLVSYWYGSEEKKELISKEEIPPKNKVIAEGTKIIWKNVETPDGERKYWKKIDNVWATSYDKSCEGCNEWTAMGTRLDVGTCAVDPKVIKMWTEIYVPGYGICRALDVGGAIKGNKIDVGFYDLRVQAPEVGWRGSHWTEIYLLDNAEE